MSTREIAIYDETYEAALDLSTRQYQGVSYNGSTGRLALGGPGSGLGVLQNVPDSKAGAACTVRHHGISRMVVNGSGTPIVIGSPIMASSGVGIVATAGNIAVGTALHPSTVNGDTIAILMTGLFRMHV